MHNTLTGCIPLGANGDGPTAIDPNVSRSDTDRKKMEANMRAYREKLKRRERTSNMQNEMLRDFQGPFVQREKTLTKHIQDSLESWVNEVDSTLSASERPLGWNSSQAKLTFRRLIQRLGAIGSSWRNQIEMHRHLDALDSDMTTFFNAVGAPTASVPTFTPAETLDRLAQKLASTIVLDAESKAGAFVRDDDDGDDNSVGNNATFGFPPEDVEPSSRRRRRSGSYRSREKELDEQIESASSGLESEQERTLFQKLLEYSIAKLAKVPKKLRGWASVKAKSVIYGMLIMAVTGTIVWAGGYLAFQVLQKSSDEIKDSAENIKNLGTAAGTTVKEVQEKLVGLNATVDVATESVRSSMDVWKELATELPPNEEGISAMALMLEKLKNSVVVDLISKRKLAPERANDLFQEIFGGTMTSFSKLRDAYSNNSISRATWGEDWLNYQQAMRTAFTGSRDVTLQQLQLVKESLGAFKDLLARSGRNIAEVITEAENIRKNQVILEREHAVYLTKSPVSAYIMKRLGDACGAGPAFGSMFFYTVEPLMKLQEVESYVRVLTGGIDEVLLSGIGGFLTNTTLWLMLQRTSLILSTAVSGALRVSALAIRMARRVGDWVRWYRTPKEANGEGEEVRPKDADAPGFWSGIEDYLNAGAAHVETANAFISIVTGGLATAANLYLILDSLARLLWMLAAWCSALYLGIAIVVGAAVFLIITSSLKISASSTASYVATQLLGYHWILAPALGALVNILSLSQGGTAPVDLVGHISDNESRVDQSTQWQQLAVLADRQKTNESIQNVLATATTEDITAARALLSDGTHWVLRSAGARL